MISLSQLKQSKAARNAAASYFAFFSTAASGLLMIPVAVQFLRKEEIGLWAVVNAAISYLVWMDLGVGAATGRKIADAISAGDQTEINRWWTATRAVLGIQGLVIILLGIACIPLFNVAFNLTGGLKNQASTLLLGSVIIAGICVPMRGVPGLLTAQERFHWVPLGQGITPWLNLAVFYVMLRTGWGLNSYIWSTGITQLISMAYYTILVRVGPLPPHWDSQGLSKTRLKSLFGFSLNLSVVGLTDAILNTLPAMILARMGGLASVPLYVFTSKAPILIAAMVRRTSQAFYPRLQSLHVSGKSDEFLKKHQQVGKLTISVGLLASFFILLFNRSIVEWLAGADFYAGDSVNVWLAMVALVMPVSVLFQSLLQISGSMGKSGVVAALNLITCVLVLSAAYHFFDLPGLAAAFSFQTVLYGTYGYVRGSRNCGFSPNFLSYKIFFHLVVAIILVATAGFISASQFHHSSWISVGSKKFTLPLLHNILICLPVLIFGIYLLKVTLESFRLKPPSI